MFRLVSRQVPNFFTVLWKYLHQL